MAQPEIKLIAVDLDGTLLRSDKRICADAASALAAAMARGVKIIIASARPPRSVRAIYEQLNLDTWQINYNGALVWDEPAKTARVHTPLTGQLVRRMVESARRMEERVLVSCEILDRWFTDRNDPIHTTETGRMFPPDLLAPLDEWIDQPITKLMFLGPEVLMNQVAPLLTAQFAAEARIMHTEPDLIQINHPTVNKGIMVAKVAQHYGIPMYQTLAIGDAPNDIDMLQAAGIGVAMGNAPEKVKQSANWIAPGNDDQGVADTLRKFDVI